MNLRVLLTGAAGDIGSAVSLRLVASGYNVIGVDKVAPKVSETYLEFFITDLTKTNQLSQSLDQIKQKYSPLWGLVHCAGIYPIVPLSSYSDDLWDEVQDVNLKSAFRIVRTMQSEMMEGGRIIFISSGAAHLGSGDVGYSSSKAGLVGLARGLAKALAVNRILVNSVCPGLIMTQMSARMTPEHKVKTEQGIPLSRSGKPEEVAVCVSFLLDPENSYMTGATIDVNGGLYMP